MLCSNWAGSANEPVRQARPMTGLAALPVEGSLPGFDGATGWLNSPPLTEADLHGKVVLTDFWTYTCINWLRTLGLRPRVGREVRGAGAGRRRRPHARVPVRAGPRQRPRSCDGHERRLPDRDRQRLRRLGRVRATGTGPPSTSPTRDGRIRHHQFGEGGYEECERVIQQLLREAGARGHRRRSRLHRSGRFRGPGRLDEPRVARDVPRLPAGSELRVSGWRRARRASHLCGAGSVEAQPLGAVRRLDGREGGDRPESKPAGGSRSASTPATSISSCDRASEARPCRSACSSTENLPATPTGSTSTSKGTERCVQPRLYQLVREPGSIADRTFEITFLAPGVEAYVFTFG